MKDSELSGLVLQYFYDKRRQRPVREPKAADLGVEVTEQDILHICDQLSQNDLLEWQSKESHRKSSDMFLPSIGRISARGIDVVEGNVPPPIEVKFVQHTNNSTVNITESTNVIAGNSITGNNNTLTLSGLAEAIESADATPQEKEEAKSLLLKVLENPLVSKIAGKAVDILGS